MTPGYEELAHRGGFSYKQHLGKLPAREREERRQNRIEWLLRASKLALEKNLESFEQKSQSRLLHKVDVQLSVLVENSFMDRAENVLVWQSSKREKLLALCPRPTDAVPGPAGTLRLRAAKSWGNAGAIQLVSP